MKTVVVVYCSMTGNTKAAADAIKAGIIESGGQAVVKDCREASADDLIQCDAVALGSYDAFSYMGGGLKDYFDRVFYPVQEKVTDKPFAAFMTHGGGGNGLASIESIAQTFKLKKAFNAVSVVNSPDEKAVAALKQLGAALVQACSQSTT